MKWFRNISSAVFGAALAAGCLVADGGECSTDSDCVSGLVCNLYAARCTPPGAVCERDEDCAAPTPVCGPYFRCLEGPVNDGGSATPAPDAGAADTGRTPRKDISLPQDVPEVSLPRCPPLPERMLRATHLAIAEAGTGFDLDDDPTTCAPKKSCEAGIDNAFAGIGGVANPELASAIVAGEMNLLLGIAMDDGITCPLLLYSRFGDGSEAPYQVDCLDNDAACLAAGAYFADACLADGDQTLSAGGTGLASFPIIIPLFGVEITVPVRHARLEGAVETGESGWISFDGVMGGMILRDELLTALENLPPMGDIDPGEMISLLIEPDMDSNGDGTADAYSVGVTVKAEAVSVECRP